MATAVDRRARQQDDYVRGHQSPMDFELESDRRKNSAFATSILATNGAAPPNAFQFSAGGTRPGASIFGNGGSVMGGMVGSPERGGISARSSSLDASVAKPSPYALRKQKGRFSFSTPTISRQKSESAADQVEEDCNVAGVKKERSDGLGALVKGLNLGGGRDLDSDEGPAREPMARKRKKISDPPECRPSTLPSTSKPFFRLSEHHLLYPYVFLGYVRLFFTLFIMSLTGFLLIQFILTVHHDLEMKAEEYSQEITQQVLDCAKEYDANGCAANRMPKLELFCRDWELCMTRDPKEVGRLKVGAETLAEILNRLFEPMTYKTMVKATAQTPLLSRLKLTL